MVPQEAPGRQVAAPRYSLNCGVLQGCGSSAAHPAPLLGILMVLGEAVAAGLSAHGPLAGQGGETNELAPAPPPELQRLSSATRLLALLSALMKAKESLHEARHAPGSKSWREEERFFGEAEKCCLMWRMGRGWRSAFLSSALCACHPREYNQHLHKCLFMPWVTPHNMPSTFSATTAALTNIDNISP